MHVHYLTRADNKFHKAGNINAALTRTNGEFVAIFDADQIPFPGFIDQTLGYFVDEKVAFVPSSVFDFTGEDCYGMRINFTRNSPELLREGIERLERAIGRCQKAGASLATGDAVS